MLVLVFFKSAIKPLIFFVDIGEDKDITDVNKGKVKYLLIL